MPQFTPEVDSRVAVDMQAKYPGITAADVAKERSQALWKIRQSLLQQGDAEMAAMTDDELWPYIAVALRRS